MLVPAQKGVGSRQRELPRVTVFWAFLGQVLLRGASCRWALTRLQADAVAKGHQPMGESTSAYCQARSALPLSWLQALFAALARWFEPRQQGRWYGRIVRLIDATGFSMPDTEKNRDCWPYAGGQKRGCGFPTGKLGGLFCLHTGRLIAFAQSTWKAHDLSLARPLLRWLHAGEVLVADRAYCGWFFLVQLLAQKSISSFGSGRCLLILAVVAWCGIRGVDRVACFQLGSGKASFSSQLPRSVADLIDLSKNQQTTA